MWQPKPLHLLAVSLCVLALSQCTVVAGDGGKPLVMAITKDAATTLYTTPLKDGHPLVLDLSGPFIWSTCDEDAAAHDTLDCKDSNCISAHRYHPPNCSHMGYCTADDGNRYKCKCTAHPHNPVTGETATGDVPRATLSANATDGRNPLRAVSFAAIASCASKSLLGKLPAGVVGVAGLARSRLAFPAQVTCMQKVGDKFALCLPSGGGSNGTVGVAIFGGGPFFLLQVERLDIITTMLV